MPRAVGMSCEIPRRRRSWAHAIAWVTYYGAAGQDPWHPGRRLLLVQQAPPNTAHVALSTQSSPPGRGPAAQKPVPSAVRRQTGSEHARLPGQGKSDKGPLPIWAHGQSPLEVATPPLAWHASMAASWLVAPLLSGLLD